MAHSLEADWELELEDAFEGELEFESSPAKRNEPGQWSGNIHGGSGSDDDRRYQRQVTGEPTYRDYVVRKGKVEAAFDGYDKKKGVLLDAKNLSDDGYVVRMWKWMNQKHAWPPEKLRRWSKSQLAEARRQMKVAGNTPIAWHVSSADGGRVLRQLLGVNGLLDDKSKRGIRVVVTPPSRATQGQREQEGRTEIYRHYPHRRPQEIKKDIDRENTNLKDAHTRLQKAKEKLAALEKKARSPIVGSQVKSSEVNDWFLERGAAANLVRSALRKTSELRRELNRAEQCPFCKTG